MKTELETKREYQSYIEKSSPDFDAMWNKIESEIENTPQIRVNKNKRIVKGIVAAAACVVVCIVGANYFGSQSLKADENIALEDNTGFSASDEMVTTTVTDTQSIVTTTPIFSEDNAVADGIIDEEPTNDCESDSPTSPGTESSPTDAIVDDKTQIIDYTHLSFLSASPLDANLSYDFDEYFVEEEMLSKTEYIVRGTITDAFVTSENTVLYSLDVNESLGENEAEYYIEIESKTPYQMLINREYILFLYKEDERYCLSFENAPQIEVTLDNQIVFHNGFKSISENSLYVKYPKTNIDDYFYDRMRFKDNADISAVVEKWRSLTER